MSFNLLFLFFFSLFFPILPCLLPPQPTVFSTVLYHLSPQVSNGTYVCLLSWILPAFFQHPFPTPAHILACCMSHYFLRSALLYCSTALLHLSPFLVSITTNQLSNSSPYPIMAYSMNHLAALPNLRCYYFYVMDQYFGDWKFHGIRNILGWKSCVLVYFCPYVARWIS